MICRVLLAALSLATITVSAVGCAPVDTPVAFSSVSGQIGPPAGSGRWPAIAESLADAPGYTIYRPSRPKGEALPVVLWGNGGCRDDGLSASHFLREIASHGYLVIANGRPRVERPALAELPPPPSPAQAPPQLPGERPADETTVAQLLAGIDLADAMNADRSGPLRGRIDTQKVAVMGHSCGGLQALSAAADPRIDTVVAFGSGVYNRSGSGLSGVRIGKDDLRKIHTPIAYVLGGPSDIAWPNGTDDFERIDHVPAVLASLPVGHGGTLALKNGGRWADFAVQWLDWQLRGEGFGKASILGQDCPICAEQGWTILSKNQR